MSKLPSFSFAPTDPLNSGAIVFLVAENGKLPELAARFDKSGQIDRAMKVVDFNGKLASTVEVMAPTNGQAGSAANGASSEIDRVVVVGIGKPSDNIESDWMKIGGKIYKATGKSKSVTIIADLAGKKAELSDQAQATIAAGIKLGAYNFDKYKTKEVPKGPSRKFKFTSTNHAATKKAWKTMEAITGGVVFARNLVNEPANILGPVEFAARAKTLTKLGCKVEVFDQKKLEALKMGSLLSVNQGSVRPPRLVVMHWNGGKSGEKPLAFVGKGVVFDTGGISIKPAGGMEDMKGDMGGAAVVCGLMQALAARKAKINVVGVIGLVENMPDGNATRPGDIVTSMSGQTIEVINTDAEGRLVLADALWYCEGRFKPKIMVNLATLTGAVIVALGNHHAGMFSNDDKLSTQLTKAGTDTNERVWRLPLAPEYDKLIDSKNADVKNTGGRMAGSITAAQFLQRFVRDTRWAHLDIAGTAMGSPKHEFNQSWGSGFGVRLLNRLITDCYE